MPLPLAGAAAVAHVDVMPRVGRDPKNERKNAPKNEPRHAPKALAGAAGDTRSPFVRLAELIAGVEPGMPTIDLGLGEPKHPVPGFVAPVMAAHIGDFCRYPRNEGIPDFRAATAASTARRHQLAPPPDPPREVIVPNGPPARSFPG